MSMEVEKDNVFILKDSVGRALGTVLVTSVQGDLVTGILEGGSDFACFRELFQKHERAVNQQLFVLVDEIEDQIKAIGPQLHSRDSAWYIGIFDLQIMNAHDVSFRLSPFPNTQQ